MLAAAVLDDPISSAREALLISPVGDAAVDPSTIDSGRIVGVRRDDELHLAPDSDFEFRPDDLLIYLRE